MRKQTDFDIRVFKINSNPEAYGGMSHTQVSDFIRENYLRWGWEVLSTQNVTYDGNNVAVQVSLVKYEDLSEEVEAPEPVLPNNFKQK